ncbi:hypothetical protein [Wolbachia endosymbiont of Ctenocephalides felis wCfeT]|uniref:hypothetical protein n=1 Tax=Wolbachia endosymbiont of Ctenocephalides felis wCfeT TaxID=2732593 RepID=UPI0014478F37|nr:hypothetical protein [Wolbachia endosymbiont of Ctenocephalides felis wCfeT]
MPDMFSDIAANAAMDTKYRKTIQFVILPTLLVTTVALVTTYFIFPLSRDLLIPLLAVLIPSALVALGYCILTIRNKEISSTDEVSRLTNINEYKQVKHYQELIRSLLENEDEVRSTIKDKFLDKLVELCYTNRDDAYKRALHIKEIDEIASSINNQIIIEIKNQKLLDYFDQFFTFTALSSDGSVAKLINFAILCKSLEKARSATRDKFCKDSFKLCFDDSEAHKIVLCIEEIDEIASTIKNKELLECFDQFFTFTELSDDDSRIKLINFARVCKDIDENKKALTTAQQVHLAKQFKLYPDGPAGGVFTPANLVSCVTMASPVFDMVYSTASQIKNYFTNDSGASRGLYFGH